jgi:hypothetical protein
MVIVKRGSSLGSTIPSDANVYNFELEDRVFYYVSSEDEHNSTARKSTSGVYQIVHIDGNFNYYLRKVKYNSVNGHLDYAKRLVSLSSTGSSISLAREDSPTNQYYWSSNNYPDSLLDVYVVSTGNTVINKTYNTDYTVDWVDWNCKCLSLQRHNYSKIQSNCKAIIKQISLCSSSFKE